MPLELPVLTVANSTVFRKWLLEQHDTSRGVWLTLAKKGTTSPTTLTYQQAVQEALCFGFIDGQSRKRDDKTYAQRFTPRTAKSAWSQRNVHIVSRLEKEHRMHASGRAAIDAAKADGRWEAAYAGSSSAEVPEDFLAEVAKVPRAKETWDQLNRQNRYVIYMTLKALKTDKGREKRIRAFVEMLGRGERPLPHKRARGSEAADGNGEDVEAKRAKRGKTAVEVYEGETVKCADREDIEGTRTTRSGRKAHARYE